MYHKDDRQMDEESVWRSFCSINLVSAFKSYKVKKTEKNLDLYGI